jgi:catechol 2,3-dioxygenase-like lactoylglutathione lyase family enzyme
MKPFHVHLGVADLDKSIAFYAGLFGAPPAVRKDDYAKWMLEDPRVNFAISTRSGEVGVNHLGLQADSAEELAGIREQFAAADLTSLQDEPDATCCYARSDKHWVTDPQGIPWEGYRTLGEVRYFSGDRMEAAAASQCCEPAPQSAAASAAERVAPDKVPATACCAPAAKEAASKASTRCCD